MPQVRVEPSNVAFEVAAGESIMAAAVRAGYGWPNLCGMQGECTVCFVRVLEGTESLSPVGKLEGQALPGLLRRYPAAAAGTVRLACQAQPGADTTVMKRGVRRQQPASS